MASESEAMFFHMEVIKSDNEAFPILANALMSPKQKNLRLTACQGADNLIYGRREKIP